ARESAQIAAVVEVALRQHGNLTRRQLLNAGFNDDGIRYWVRRGWLYRVYRSVYAVGRPPQTALERASAAVLACGPTAALSHLPALALWGLAGWPASVEEVVVSEDRRPSGIRAHRVSTLLPRDVRRRHGIRITSPARTMLDCTPSLTDRRLTRVVNEAKRTKLLKPHHLTDLLIRCPTHPGAPKLRRFAESEATGPTRSELEDLFLALCEEHKLPRPKVNTQVNGYEVDFYFEAEKLIVEVDGWDFHRSRDAFERDRSRDSDASEAGIETIRITYHRISQRPEREAVRLHKVLTRRQLTLASERARRSAPRP
ncbi:MAG TPA: type IV toxin-antitoxin system AbiEi family antitoxin domain-containing protein, partial [Solirubrobacteraceae bacterium]